MHALKAALEAYARRYASLGLRIDPVEAQALVASLVQSENPDPAPSTLEVYEMACSFVQRIDEITHQRT